MRNYPATLIVLTASLLLGTRASAVTIDNSTYRIGMSFDGNQHDRDDFGGAPLSMAMAAEAGIGGKLVHVDYNCHLGDNNDSWATTMNTNVTGAKSRWGLSTAIFNDQTNLSGAIASIAAQINASTSGDRFYFGCVGPMEVPWRGINASNTSARTFVTCVSHSTWNETHADTNQMTHTWTQIKNTGVQTVHILDQNTSNGDEDFSAPKSKWFWLRDGPANWNWLYNRNVKTAFDVSDAGVMWYIITGRGDQKGGSTKTKDLFNGNFTYLP